MAKKVKSYYTKKSRLVAKWVGVHFVFTPHVSRRGCVFDVFYTCFLCVFKVFSRRFAVILYMSYSCFIGVLQACYRWFIGVL